MSPNHSPASLRMDLAQKSKNNYHHNDDSHTSDGNITVDKDLGNQKRRQELSRNHKGWMSDLNELLTLKNKVTNQSTKFS
jgi:hypothetical protein